MRGNLFGGFALRFEKRVAGQSSANGIGHRFASTTVQIDAGIIITGQQQRIVGGPKRSGKHVGDTRLASAIARVAFGHPYARTDLTGRSRCDTRCVLHLLHRRQFQQVQNINLGVGRRPAKVIMMKLRVVTRGGAWMEGH